MDDLLEAQTHLIQLLPEGSNVRVIGVVNDQYDRHLVVGVADSWYLTKKSPTEVNGFKVKYYQVGLSIPITNMTLITSSK